MAKAYWETNNPPYPVSGIRTSPQVHLKNNMITINKTNWIIVIVGGLLLAHLMTLL